MIGVVPHPHGVGVVDTARFPRRRNQHDGVRVPVSERIIKVRAVAVRVRGLARWTNEDLLGPAEAALVGRVELQYGPPWPSTPAGGRGLLEAEDIDGLDGED